MYILIRKILSNFDQNPVGEIFHFSLTGSCSGVSSCRPHSTGLCTSIIQKNSPSKWDFESVFSLRPLMAGEPIFEPQPTTKSKWPFSCDHKYGLS